MTPFGGFLSLVFSFIIEINGHRDPITSGTPAGARYRVTVRPWRWDTLALDLGWRPWAQRS